MKSKAILLAVLLAAFPIGASAAPEEVPGWVKLTLLGEAYRYVCESQGGKYVNDNPSFIQAWSCYLPKGTWKPRG